MAIDNVALFDQAEAVLEHLLALGGKARDNVRANRCFGARRLDPLDKSDCLFAAVAPLHPLEDHVVARLQREVQVRHNRSEEHTSELQSLMRISYAVSCLTKKTKHQTHTPPEL